MQFFSPSKLLLAAGLLNAALAHNIQLPAHGRECFHEQLHKDDKMTVTFQVGDREFGSAGNLDIDFWVCSLKDLMGFEDQLLTAPTIDHQPPGPVRGL